ncbi:MAG: phytoene/squalene synthase family protein [Kineosporiaceae bacterium]
MSAAAGEPPVRIGRSARRCLDAAGITDPWLREAYERCRRLNAEHGKTYYLATLLLPPAKRPHVWALYGFARYADEFVDSLEHPEPEELLRWGAAFQARLDRADATALTRAGAGAPSADARVATTQTAPADGAPADPVGDPIAAAMTATMRRWAIPRDTVDAFLESMRMDITVTEYPTYADLQHYMYGSASVIGLQMLPILQPHHPEAAERAQALGEAFQMSNFLRDVGEDLRRGRVYLPLEDLAAFGVTREDLLAGVTTTAIRDLVAFEVERTRALYAVAEPGIAMLHPDSQDCVRTAFVLYGGILGEIEKARYDVLTERVSVPLPRRLAVALPALRRARAARRATGL